MGNEYWQKGSEVLQLSSKGRYGSFHLWINVWVEGKTVWFLINTCHIWAPQRKAARKKAQYKYGLLLLLLHKIIQSRQTGYWWCVEDELQAGVNVQWLLLAVPNATDHPPRVNVPTVILPRCGHSCNPHMTTGSHHAVQSLKLDF